MIVVQLVFVRFQTVRHVNAPVAQIDLLHVAVEEPHALEHLANRIDDMRHVKIARRHFVQHRREQSEVLFIDQRNLDVRISREGFFQMQSRIQAAKTTAENDDSCFFLCAHFDFLLDWAVLNVVEMNRKSLQFYILIIAGPL